MNVDAMTFKAAMRMRVSGVAIVTCRTESGPFGMTVSAFSEVSLEPPLVLVCADRSSETRAAIEQSRTFTLSLLAAEQADLSQRFGDRRRVAERFTGLPCEEGATGCPRIPGALAWIDCTLESSLDAGDHVILLGRVVDAVVKDGDPLVYFRSGYRRIEPL
jgi:flavin reductase (DIM6/NTAB) family NADH-FMN oxidoreductase RutF